MKNLTRCVYKVQQYNQTKSVKLGPSILPNPSNLLEHIPFLPRAYQRIDSLKQNDFHREL